MLCQSLPHVLEPKSSEALMFLVGFQATQKHRQLKVIIKLTYNLLHRLCSESFRIVLFRGGTAVSLCRSR